MLFRSPLLANLSRYRKSKRLSLDGSVAGIEVTRSRGTPAQAEIGPWGYPPKEYLAPTPQTYDPHPGFAQFPEPEYEIYDAGMANLVTPMRRDPGPPRAVTPTNATPEYSHSVMTDELLAEAMRVVDGPVPVDVGQESMDAPSSLEGLVENLLQHDPVQEIEAAIDQQLQNMAEAFEPPQPEPIDPAELQMYEQQMMDPFGMPGMGPM